ncbi:MAG: LytR C-terminal domain-containing protein, partial [Actinomycetota bacterium]|nr:LytR C-terminal domain-containing protein [Actinomycetota bacterium]
MGRAVVVAVLGTIIGVAIAGFPDRSTDPPLRLSPGGAPPDQDAFVTGPPVVDGATSTSTTRRSPRDVRVLTVNASQVPGAARRVGTRLQEAGYAVAPPVPDQRRFEQSFVRYRPGSEAEAATVATMVGVDAEAVGPLSTEPSV